MFKNHLLVTFRNLWKTKGYSFLNVFGLAVGMACAALIFLWVEDELGWDRFHAGRDRLYYVRENQKYDTYTATFGSTPGLLGPAMQAEIPGIASTCRTSEGGTSYLFTVGDRSMYANGIYVEPSFFSMFSFPFVEGNAKDAFRELHSLVITQAAARKFFGRDRNVTGKTIRMDNKQDYVVTGVLADVPGNSTIQFEWLAPFEIYFQQSEWLHHWGNNSLSTYVQLQPGVDPASVDKRLYNFIQQREPESIARPFLFSMGQWRLYDQFDNGKLTGGGRIEYVRMFSVIAWIILFIACINFMNLATARSENRAREVGVRKVLGAGRNRLVAQFLGEAMFMSVIAAVAAVIIVALALPAFNTLVQKNLSLHLGSPVHIAALLLLTLVCGLAAGSYPSIYLSAFNPVFVLKGLRVKGGSASMIRKGLVVFQFTMSIVLIICTLIIFQQIQHVKSRNLGFNKNNLLELNMQGEMYKNAIAIQHDLAETGIVTNSAFSDHTMIWGGNNTDGLTWDGKPATAKILVSTRYVSPEFMKTMDLRLIEGRDFTYSDTPNEKKHLFYVIITESLEKLMGKGSAVGKLIRYQGDTSGLVAQVAGVVSDYVYGNMYTKPDPVLFVCTFPENTTVMYVRLKPEASTETALAKIETILKKENPVYPFSYIFVDDQFNAMFASEMLISKLSRLFAALAIIISCLGLLGLAAYTTERRTKEIGIRKVLGASIAGIARLVSVDFLKLVGISALIAFPVAWWSMHHWLQGFAYRIGISWWVFVASGVTAILIALLTISFQAMRAARANPVKCLRTE